MPLPTYEELTGTGPAQSEPLPSYAELVRPEIESAAAAGAAAMDATFAPYAMNWGPAADAKVTELMVEDERLRARERELARNGPGREPVFTPRPDGSVGAFSDWEQAIGDIRVRRKSIASEVGRLQPPAETSAEPSESERFQQWMRDSGQAPGFFNTAMHSLTSDLLNQGAGVIRQFVPSFGDAGNAVLEQSNRLRDAAAAHGTEAAINPTIGGGIARGIGQAGSLILGTPAGKVGVMTTAARAAMAAKEQALSQGLSDSEADAAASHTYAVMAAYLGAGGLAARAGSAMAGPGATAGQRALASGGAALASNVGTSATISAVEGTPYGVENITQDVIFALPHALQSVRHDPDTGIVRTPAGPVKDGRVIAPESPEGIAAVAMKGPEAVQPTEVVPVEPIVQIPEERQPQSPPAESPVSVPEVEPVVEPEKPSPPGVESEVGGVPVGRVNTGQIATRPDVMQFKRMTDQATGAAEHHAETISGEWDDIKAGNLLLWEPMDPKEYGLRNGQKYIVADGHGRFLYGGKAAVKSFNAQILREADGISAQDARTIAAEKNIADGKGTIYDQAKFLRNAAAAHGTDEALARARRQGIQGRKAATIAFSASDPTYDSFVNEVITPEQAAEIAKAAPGNEAAQQVGLRAIARGKDAQQAANEVQAAMATTPGEQMSQGDMFANTAMQAQWEKIGDYATAKQRELTEQVRAVQNAARNPETAAKFGVDVKDPAGILRRIDELKAERERWQNYSKHPDLLAEARGTSVQPPAPGVSLGGSPEPPALPKLRSMETQGDLLSTQAEPEAFKLAGETGTDFDAAAQEQAARDAAKAESDKLQGSLFGDEPAGPERNLGPGAANVEEPIQTGPGSTSTKNAVMEAERAARGADPIIKEARQTNPETLERAEQRIDSDPQAGAKLVERLISSTDRTISVEEEAVLLVEKVRLRNERAQQEERMADPNASPEERSVAQLEWQRLEGEINRMDEATHASGAIWGRLGQFRQRLLRSDYTFEAMERRARASKQGPLTPEESAKIKEQADKLAELQTKLDAVTKAKDEEFSGVSVDEAIRQIESEASKDPAFTPEVRSLADRIIASLDATANAALTRLRGKFGRTNVLVDPTILSDLVIYGASKIAKGFIKFGQWSTSMVREFGEDVKPYLSDAWKGANERLDAAVEKVPGKHKDKVKAAVRKTDTAGKLDEITAGMKESATEGTPLREMRRDVQRLAENFVRSGIKQREPLIDAVHEVVTEIDPSITRRETMDMISGYGDFKPLNPDQIKAELRDLKGQMQQVGKLEDITARKPLQKSGVEQRAPSNEERRLIQQVNEAKRRFGVVVTDPARQLKSALDARKTYVRNRLSDLRSEIANRQRVVKERSLPPTDPELENLRAELDTVKAEHEAVFGKRELTDEQRLKLAISAAERTEAQWTKRLADAQKGIFPTGKEASKVPKSAQLDAIKARVEAAKSQVQELQDIADPNKALRSRLAARTAELQDKLARGDFSTRKRREYDVSKDPEAVRLLAEKQKVQDQFNAARERDRLRNRTILQKIWGGVKETLNLPRNILSSWDVSGVLRQGGFIGFGNPLRSIRATGTMLKALFSEKAAANADAQIRSRPNAPLYEKAKLYLPKLDDPRLTAQEEQIMSRVANKIPGLRASNRAFLTFLNKLRADSFDTMVASLTKKGAATQAELDAISSYINIATGRGDLGKAALAAETLATAFFSPRLLASRFQLIGSALSGFRYGGGSVRTRKAIATEYAKTLLGLSVVIGLGKLSGAQFSLNPSDPDFLKLKFGNTRVDPMMGLAQVTRFIAGEAMAVKRFFTKEKPKWGQGGADIFGRFLRTKLTPVLGTALDIVQQKNVVGEKVTPQSAATQLVIPLSFRDIADVMKEHGMTQGTIFELLSLFGMSVNNYQEKKRR